MSSMSIILRGSPNRKERAAGGTIKPGHLLKLNSSNAVVVHNVAGGTAQKMFAVEDELKGSNLTVAYSSGQRVQYNVFSTGDEVQCRLKASENVSIGDPLVSAGDGTLQKYTGTSAGVAEFPNSIVAFALAASNTSDEVLLAVEVA